MSKVKIKAICKPDCKIPRYETDGAVGMDLRGYVNENIKFMYNCERAGDKLIINPFGRALIGTGLFIQLPDGYEAQIRPRSGLTIKHGIICQLGSIDSDYRGEIGLIIINFSDEPYYIENGERLAQMVINKVEQAEIEIVDSLDDTDRGEGGFGHTG